MTGKLDLKLAMEDWYKEYQYYNYSTLACKEGEMCGHYTQVSKLYLGRGLESMPRKWCIIVLPTEMKSPRVIESL